MGTEVEKRVQDLRQEIERLVPIRNVAYEDLAGLMKQRSKAIAKLAAWGDNSWPPSDHIRSMRARQKMSKKTYNAVMVRTKFFFKEKYAKKSHLLSADVTDNHKAIMMVLRYERALTEKINALVEELGNEYNSESWNKMIHDKRIAVDTKAGAANKLLPRSTMQLSPLEARTSAAARAKAKGAPKMGRSMKKQTQGSGIAKKEQPMTAPPTPLLGQLSNFHLIEVKHFKGPWSVICGPMKAEATVDVDGYFDMHEKYRRGWPGGWSSLRCKVVADHRIRTFTSNIDSMPWKMVEAEMDSEGKSVVVWESRGMPQSIWTRMKASKAALAVEGDKDVPARSKAKAKTQARRTPAAGVTTPEFTGSAAIGGPTLSSAVPGSPTPSPAEWYTEIRDGRLMWTDGISAVPAEERVTDDNRQKTKMQF